MVDNTESQLREQVGRAMDTDATWHRFHTIDDPVSALDEDVARVRTHPLIPRDTVVGGFIYDVDTGLIDRIL